MLQMLFPVGPCISVQALAHWRSLEGSRHSFLEGMDQDRWAIENSLSEIFAVFLGQGSLPEIRKINKYPIRSHNSALLVVGSTEGVCDNNALFSFCLASACSLKR